MITTRFNGHLIVADTVDEVTRAEYAVALATGMVTTEWSPWRIDAPRTAPQILTTPAHDCADYAWCHGAIIDAPARQACPCAEYGRCVDPTH